VINKKDWLVIVVVFEDIVKRFTYNLNATINDKPLHTKITIMSEHIKSNGKQILNLKVLYWFFHISVKVVWSLFDICAFNNVWRFQLIWIISEGVIATKTKKEEGK